jgi:hypothetical protein
VGRYLLESVKPGADELERWQHHRASSSGGDQR